MESWKFHESASRAGSYAFAEVQRGRNGAGEGGRERKEKEERHCSLAEPSVLPSVDAEEAVNKFLILRSTTLIILRHA